MEKFTIEDLMEIHQALIHYYVDYEGNSIVNELLMCKLVELIENNIPRTMNDADSNIEFN